MMMALAMPAQERVCCDVLYDLHVILMRWRQKMMIAVFFLDDAINDVKEISVRYTIQMSVEYVVGLFLIHSNAC